VSDDECMQNLVKKSMLNLGGGREEDNVEMDLTMQVVRVGSRWNWRSIMPIDDRVVLNLWVLQTSPQYALSVV
jgi:hypothetical protein